MYAYAYIYYIYVYIYAKSKDKNLLYFRTVSLVKSFPFYEGKFRRTTKYRSAYEFTEKDNLKGRPFLRGRKERARG